MTTSIRTQDFEISDWNSMEIQTATVDRLPIVVVDGLYRFPERVRAAALSRTYRHRTASYPGPEANLVIPGYGLRSFVEHLMNRLWNKQGDWVRFEQEPISVVQFLPKEYHLQPVTKRIAPPQGDYLLASDLVTFAALSDLESLPNLPHYDGVGRFYASVVYLNTPEQCHGGTAFYRHRRTDLAHVPLRVSDEQLEAWDYPSMGALADDLSYSSVDPRATGQLDWEPKWEQHRVLEMRFNRMVLYDGSLLHGILMQPGAFGAALDTTRLTHNTFFSPSAEETCEMPKLHSGDPTVSSGGAIE